MSGHLSDQDRREIYSWQEKIEEADRNNILCHCRHCDTEWIDSSWHTICRCGSADIERISCWQFPDD
jgi:hypothetical protein